MRGLLDDKVRRENPAPGQLVEARRGRHHRLVDLKTVPWFRHLAKGRGGRMRLCDVMRLDASGLRPLNLIASPHPGSAPTFPFYRRARIFRSAAGLPGP